MTLRQKEKTMKDCLIYQKISKTYQNNIENGSTEHSLKNHGTDHLDKERKNCANMFPRVRKQMFLLAASVCFNYVSFIDHS